MYAKHTEIMRWGAIAGEDSGKWSCLEAQAKARPRGCTYRKGLALGFTVVVEGLLELGGDVGEGVFGRLCTDEGLFDGPVPQTFTLGLDGA